MRHSSNNSNSCCSSGSTAIIIYVATSLCCCFSCCLLSTLTADERKCWVGAENVSVYTNSTRTSWRGLWRLYLLTLFTSGWILCPVSDLQEKLLSCLPSFLPLTAIHFKIMQFVCFILDVYLLHFKSLFLIWTEHSLAWHHHLIP